MAEWRVSVMPDREFVRYMISEFATGIPSGIRYKTQKEAHDAALRYAESEHKTYYVHEVVYVCNILEQINAMPSPSSSIKVGEWDA